MRLLAISVAALLVTWPQIAAACPICASRGDGASYLTMTGLLLSVPLLLIAGFALWLWRADGRRQRDEDNP